MKGMSQMPKAPAGPGIGGATARPPYRDLYAEPMKSGPGDIDQRELARILDRRWSLAGAGLRYLPAGFGDHHWGLTDGARGRWFVTVAALAGGWRGTGPEAGYADLRAAMETVTALGQAGLEFAVAPVPTADGQALARLGDGHAVTAMRMYKMRWSLDDIALAVRDFRAPHEQNEDSGLTWETLSEEIGEIA